MISFPTLLTGAVAQYPAGQTIRFQNQILRFLDGTDQRYRDTRGSSHTWEIRLQKLTEGELAAIDAFFLEMSGSFGSFLFTDPWDGTVYPNCSLSADSLTVTSIAETQGSTTLKVVENRS
jgi:phage-related protein